MKEKLHLYTWKLFFFCASKKKVNFCRENIHSKQSFYKEFLEKGDLHEFNYDGGRVRFAVTIMNLDQFQKIQHEYEWLSLEDFG